METKNKEIKRVIDRTKILKNLQLSASVVPPLQVALLHIVGSLKDPSTLPAIYKKINDIGEKIQTIGVNIKKEDLGGLELSSVETSIYILTILINYLKEEADKQNCMIEVKANSPDIKTTQGLLKHIMSDKEDDHEKVKTELLEKMIKSMNFEEIKKEK